MLNIPFDKKLFWSFFAAAIPVIALSLFFPDRALDSFSKQTYDSVPGADIVAFVQQECPHCRAFKNFALKQNWEVEYLDVTIKTNQDLFEKLQERAPTLTNGVPTIIINGTVLQGYETDATTGTALNKMLSHCRQSDNGCLPFQDFLQSNQKVAVQSSAAVCTDNCEIDTSQYQVKLWFFGTVDLTLLSLPVLSVLLGFLDGFNPCAMWVLITLLTLLINTREMKKVWVIGGVFLFISGAVYYLFIAAWLEVFKLIGLNMIVQKIIGLVAIGGGAFYLYEAFGKNPSECKVTNLTGRQKIIARMKKVMEISKWPLMIIGVSILAVSVNMIELVCTAGLPVVFTQILAFNNVSDLTRYSYMALYILLYMIDDIVIFTIAVYTLHATGLTNKYRRFTLIFGGILMYCLGMLLIFAPEWLVFGG